MITFLLSVILVTAPVAFSQDDDIAAAIADCETHMIEFEKTEDQYTQKSPLPPDVPDLSVPVVPTMAKLVYSLEKLQRPFECLTDIVQESNSSLYARSQSYRDMVGRCIAKRSEIRPYCVRDYPYRTHNGTCNNLEQPVWGAAPMCGTRLTSADYIGSSDFRRSVCDNGTLPNPREVSVLYMTGLPVLQLNSSSHFMFFGQFLAHDVIDTAATFVGDKHLECCKDLDTKMQHPQCAPILLENDFFYRKFNVTCFNFVRGAICDACAIGKRDPINAVTSYIDLSTVYGTNENNAELRTFDSGLLRSQEKSSSGELLPKNENTDPSTCGHHVPLSGGILRKKRQLEGLTNITSVIEGGMDTSCFSAGDRRVNQHSMLMIYHTLFFREHNRIAKELKSMNPQWSDERLYQVARQINIAQFQVIVYREFLLHLLTPKHMTEFDLWLGDGSTRTQYDPSVNAGISAEFAAAAYRLHPMVDRKVGLVEPDVRYTFVDTTPLYIPEQTERYIAGIGTWPYKIYTRQMSNDLHHYTYKRRTGKWGFDLAAVNIQRGRDLGLPPYVDLLKAMRNIEVNDFDDLADIMSEEKIRHLRMIYCDVRDIDAWIGIVSETKDFGMRVSTTTAKILGQQFRNLKFGDRFYLEHGQDFNDAQLKELLKASLSRIFCDNTNSPIAPPKAMEAVLPFNKVGPCILLPQVDLSLWKE